MHVAHILQRDYQ